METAGYWVLIVLGLMGPLLFIVPILLAAGFMHVVRGRFNWKRDWPVIKENIAVMAAYWAMMIAMLIGMVIIVMGTFVIFS
jgi:hypothetical protein